MANRQIEKGLSIFAGISAGDVDLARQLIDSKHFLQHNLQRHVVGDLTRLPGPPVIQNHNQGIKCDATPSTNRLRP